MKISNRTLLIVICVTLFVLLLLCGFIVGTYVSYHVMKWLNINIKNKLYFDTYKHGTETILNKYGDLPIKRVYLIRRNIDSLLSFFLDLVTWRSYSTQLRELRKKINDNTFFPNHTCLMVEVELQDHTRKIIMIEKTNGVNVTLHFKQYESQEMMKVNLKKGKSITINELLNTTIERIGTDEFFNWSLYKNNCQKFIAELLHTMKKTNIKYKNFNSQPNAYEVKISDPVLYMMNYTTNLVSFLESIYLEMTI